MRLLAIDPGPEQSAVAIYDTTTSRAQAATMANDLVRLHFIRAGAEILDELAIEMVASYGMPVGAEVFDTCVWIGRFIEQWASVSAVQPRYVYRQQVKLHLCHDSRASDANIRQALIDRHGGKTAAIGRKRTPGPLYGITGHAWAALAVAITAAENGLQ